MEENAARRKEHFPALDGLRGLAIILVFLFHALGASFTSDQLAWAGWHRAGPISVSLFLMLPAYLGRYGVALFFVVSGFCIHWSHQRSREQGWRVFFARRFFRIYPPYLAALLLFAFLWPTSRLSFGSRHDVDQIISHVLLLHNNLGPGFVWGINPSFWSIGTEVQLYLLYPALLLIALRFGWRRALFLATGLEVGLRALWSGLDTWTALGPWLGGDPLMYWCSWALGAALAEDILKERPLLMARFPLWIWPMLAVGSYFVRPLACFAFLLWASATTAILARVLTGRQRFWSGFLESRILRGVGLISYSVYLLHQPLLQNVARMMGMAEPWKIYAACLTAFPLILLISLGFYAAAERPSISLGKCVLGRRPKVKKGRFDPGHVVHTPKSVRADPSTSSG